MKIKNYATALPAAAGLAVLLAACGTGTTSHPAAGSTTSHPAAGTVTSPAVSTTTVTDQDDSNWARYVVTSTAGFTSVSGSWTQPAADCAAGAPSHSAFWIGLGGYTGDTLEQTGTAADCSAGGQATYSAWYELVPAAEVPVSITVAPGDHLTARVAATGTTITITLSDVTRHATVTKQLTMSDPTVSSAEWIAEAPSACTSSSTSDCHILSLTDFGTVTFTGATATAAGDTGSISSGLGPVSALTLAANPGYGRLYATAAQANATPGTLSGNGITFTVTWQRPEVQTPGPPDIQSGPIYN
jgi:Peptidase A4 family